MTLGWYFAFIALGKGWVEPVLEAALAPAPHEAIKGAPLAGGVPAVAVLTAEAPIALGPQVKVVVVAVAGAVGIVLRQAWPGVVRIKRMETEGAAKKAHLLLHTLHAPSLPPAKLNSPYSEKPRKPNHHVPLLNFQRPSRPTLPSKH